MDDRFRRDQTASNDCQVESQLIHINAVLAAAGYNFGLLLRWLAGLLRALLQALFTALSDPQPA